jgi:glycolate oxidase FAD binding subunit
VDLKQLLRLNQMHAFNYTLHNRTPAEIVAPTSVEALADALQAAAAAGRAVVPWGGGTRQHLGAPPQRYDIALDLSILNQVVEYSPSDLVISVQAGATLAAVQALLAANGQWLPWDAPLPAQATIGGLLASGAAGPLRLGYGAPRDWTLGMLVVLGDGRLVRSGAKVVKNVAGYDAHKLHLGAFGTLGVIAEVICKVAPLPAERETLLAVFSEPRAAVLAAEQLRAAPLQPIALVALNDDVAATIPALENFLEGQPPHILVAARFAGTGAAVQRQVCTAAQHCAELGARTIELGFNDDETLWATLADFSAPMRNGSLLIRVGAPVSAVMQMARLMESVPEARNWPSARFLLAGVGIGYTRWDVVAVPAEEQVAALDELRAAMRGIGGYAVVEEAAPVVSASIDRWGPAPATLDLMRALRSQWDPAGVLNPGRYLVP